MTDHPASSLERLEEACAEEESATFGVSGLLKGNVDVKTADLRFALTLISTLRADNERLTAQVVSAVEGAQPLWPGEVAALKADNERLREVLRPFANSAACMSSSLSDGHTDTLSPQGLTVGDFRRAAAALGEGT